MSKWIISLWIVCFFYNAKAQSSKLYDYNNIAWNQFINTIAISKKTSLHTEYNWRRANLYANWQQSLVRVGFNYKQDENLMLHIGYANALTFVYGDYPLAANGKFVEHRLYEQINLKHNYQRLQVLQRLRIEQRWLAVLKANGDFDKWIFLHRLRYLLRTQMLIKNNFYIAASNELFIGAGKNLGINIFDQNRLQLLIGKKISKAITVELGYLNQVLQQGKLVNNTLVLQKNNGLLLAVYTNL